MTTIKVNLSQNYNVIIAPKALEQLGEHTNKLLPEAGVIAVITDDNVGELYLEAVEKSLAAVGFEVIAYSIKSGEASKCASVYIDILNWLASKSVTKTDVILALGGGVVGDLAGFVAATYLRGVPFIQAPTSLLAMVDSSVGGKVAIDLDVGKNLVGAFYQPTLVICDTDTLNTLPKLYYNDGMAEVIKYGMLGDSEFLDKIIQLHDDKDYETLITACVKMKRDIVQNDEFDKGERRLLNFGHTIGHAIESLSEYKISHGAAVSIGMVMMCRAAIKKGFCPSECLDVLLKLLSYFALPTTTDYSAEAIYKAALKDKKRSGEFITIIIPTDIGKCELKKVSTESLLDWIEMGIES